MKRIASCFLFVALTCRSAFAESLPTNVFRNLAGGKPQSVATYGTSLTDKGAWAGEVKAYFDANYPKQVTFTNAAKSGMNSDWGVSNLASRVLAQKPDLVFIEFAVNDAATKHNISTEKCRDNLDRMVKEIRALNPKTDIVLQTMNPAWDSPDNPEKKYGSDRPDLAEYYDVYRRYAAEHKLPLVDNYPEWAEYQKTKPEEFQRAVEDGIHPHSGPSREVTWKNVKALLEKARAAVNSSPPATTAAPAATPAPTPVLTNTVIDVWPEGKMPGSAAKTPEGRAEGRGTEIQRISNISHPTLTAFPSAKGNAPRPAVIICPGGGYSYVVVDKEGSEIAEWLNGYGITAFVLKYRAPNNRAGAFADIQRAIALVRSKAGELGIDPKKIGVIGFSAGGHLSARASTQFGQRSYPAIDEVDAVGCRPDFAMLVYPAYLGKDGQVSPDMNIQADIPPTLIVHSQDDSNFVEGSKIYHAALDAANKPSDYKLYATGGHGYGLRCEREARDWPNYAADWLRKIGVIGKD